MKTFLYEEHLKLKAKMVPFAGYEMPLQYTSIIQEHLKVRSSCGLFDISHMGLFEVENPDFLVTNHLPKEPCRSSYAILCSPEGGCIDDLLIYKWSKNKYWIVGNASNREADAHAFQTKPLDLGMIALQGKDSPELLNLTWTKNHFEKRGDLVFAATGYTGEVGFEIIGPHQALKKLYLELLALGVTPCGLGCRDTLRLEMGYPLYGHELSQEISPLESVGAWAVKLDKEFQGKAQCIAKNHRQSYGVELLEKGVPREGYAVYQKGEKIGVVTSGTFSPTLQKGIALVLVQKALEMGNEVEIEIRNIFSKAKVVKLPFLKR